MESHEIVGVLILSSKESFFALVLSTVLGQAPASTIGDRFATAHRPQSMLNARLSADGGLVGSGGSAIEVPDQDDQTRRGHEPDHRREEKQAEQPIDEHPEAHGQDEKRKQLLGPLELVIGLAEGCQRFEEGPLLAEDHPHHPQQHEDEGHQGSVQMIRQERPAADPGHYLIAKRKKTKREHTPGEHSGEQGQMCDALAYLLPFWLRNSHLVCLSLL